MIKNKYISTLIPLSKKQLIQGTQEIELKYNNELRFKDKMLRVHRKALVAKEYLLGIRRSSEGWTASLDGVETQPPVSRRHLTRVRQVLATR